MAKSERKGLDIVKAALVDKMEEVMSRYDQYKDHFRNPQFKLAIVTQSIEFGVGDLIVGEMVLVNFTHNSIDFRPVVVIARLSDGYDGQETVYEGVCSDFLHKILLLEQ